MTETAILEKLDALIAVLKRPAIPADQPGVWCWVCLACGA